MRVCRLTWREDIVSPTLTTPHNECGSHGDIITYSIQVLQIMYNIKISCYTFMDMSGNLIEC